MPIYISSGAFRTRHLPDIVRGAEVLGHPYLELSSGVDHYPRLDDYLPALKRSPLQFLVHNYFPAPAQPFVLNLGALEPTVLEMSREHVRRCLSLSAELGGSYYSVHSAFVLGLSPEALGKPAEQASIRSQVGPEERQESLSVFVDSLKALTRQAADLDLGLLVENNVISPEYIRLRGVDPFLMTTAAEIEDLFARVNAPNLRLLLDVAHARVSATALGFDPGEFVQRVKPHIGALHLSDNDGQADQNLPIREDSWFWPHLQGLGQLDAVIEVYEIDDVVIRSQIELVRQQLDRLG